MVYTIVEATADVAIEMASEYTRIAGIKDVGEQQAAIKELTAKQATMAGERVEKVNSEAKAKSDAALKDVTDFGQDLNGAFKSEVWTNARKQKFLTLAKANDGVNRISVVVDVKRETVGEGDAAVTTVTLNEPLATTGKVIGPRAPKAPGSGNGKGGGAVPLTVDGTTYPSASAAKVALLPGKEDSPMSRSAVISALGTAGKTVTE